MTSPPPTSNGPNRHAPRVLHVVAENPEDLQNGLNAAVVQLRTAATTGDSRGILITRRSRSLFTVEASADVPYGTTIENDRWQRRAAPLAAGTGDEAVQ